MDEQAAADAAAAALNKSGGRKAGKDKPGRKAVAGKAGADSKASKTADGKGEKKTKAPKKAKDPVVGAAAGSMPATE